MDGGGVGVGCVVWVVFALFAFWVESTRVNDRSNS